MFKNCLLPAAYNVTSVQSKCGEIFYGNERNFLLVCCLCQMKHFAFEDFVCHIKNVHFDEHEIKAPTNGEDNLQKPKIKKEHDCVEDEEDKQTNCENEINTSGSENTMHDREWQSDLNEEQSVEEDPMSQDSYDDEKEQHRVLKKPRQPKEYKCSHCCKSYTTEKYLNIHIKLGHLQPKPYKCDSCDLAFCSERSLDTHRRNVHIGFPCAQCDKVYKTKKQMLRHAEAHSGERKYVCTMENCGKAFRTQHCLTSHKRVHTRERNFVCEICGYRSFYKDGLIVHRRSHTGEKPFQCTSCERCFASKPLLVEHQAMHSTDRPYKCDKCESSFSRPKALYHHKHLHLGIKKFVCKICGNAYAQAAGLSAHMRNHKMTTITVTV